MEPRQWLQVKTLLATLIDLPHAQRQDHLQNNCDDPVVKMETRSLLSEYECNEFNDFPKTERFLPRRKVGTGTFGTVFEAYDGEQQIVLALKVLKQHDPRSLASFKEEFYTLTEVDHPNLVKLYQLFGEGSECFFTMQLIRGKSFLEHLNTLELSRAAHQTYDHVRDSFLQLARGVQALHQFEKTHSDLKPDNILVNHAGKVILIDLGLARELSDPPARQSVAILGSPQYMSPEQGRGGFLTKATDWYSVGIILFEALTGRCPFDGEIADIIENKRTRAAPDPSEFAPDVPDDLNTLCHDLLQRRPADRPTGSEILRRLGDARTKTKKSTPRREPFVGREVLLRQLISLLELTQDSRTCVVANLRGKSGIGKSRLLREFQQKAKEEWRELVFLRGRCHESVKVRFKLLDPLVDRLSVYLKSLKPSGVKALLPRDIASLVRLFPALKQVNTIARARLSGFSGMESQEIRDRAFEALIELLGRLGETRPVVISMDDVQWADSDSATFFRHLLNHHAPPNVLILTSGRSEDVESSPFLQQFREEISCPENFSRAIQIANFDLDELSSGEGMQLVRRLLPDNPSLEDDTAAIIVRESEGSPFLIVEFVRYAVVCADEGRQPIFTLDEVMRQRISALPAAARTLLTVVAVAGRPVPQIVAHKAAHLESDDFPGLQSLKTDKLVRVRETIERITELETYHDRYREAVLKHLDPEKRRETHHRLATALAEQATPDPAFIADQYRMAEDRGLSSRYYLLAAERATAALVFDQASECYALARQLGSYPQEEDRRLAALHGEALVNSGRGAAAAEVFLRSAANAPAVERLELQRRAAEQLLRSGNLRDGLLLVKTVARTLGIWISDKTWQTTLSIVCSRLMISWRWRHIRYQESTMIRKRDLAILDTYWSLAVGLSLVDAIRASDFGARHFLKSLSVGELKRITLSLALQAGHLNLQGNKSLEAAGMLTRAKELARELGEKPVLATVEAMGAVCGYLSGNWRVAYASGFQAEQLLRQECTGVRWEIVSACIFSLKCLNLMGNWRTYAERLPPLLNEARVKGDRYAHTGLLLLTHSYILDLVADDSAASRRRIRDALSDWSQEGFHLQDFFAFYGEVETDLYEGHSAAALERVNQIWPRLKHSLLWRGQVLRILALHLRVRSQLALASDVSVSNPVKSRELLHVAIKGAVEISRTKTPWGCALASLHEAAIFWQLRKRGKCLSALAAAEVAFTQANMEQYRASARWCMGCVLGGTEGADLIRSAESWMTEQGVKSPRRMILLFAPGEWNIAVGGAPLPTI